MNLPFFESLESSTHVLLAGAGGGFDVFASLPLYHNLRKAGKRVSLANLSFSHLLSSAGENLTPNCIGVTAESDGSNSYFPERYLAEFLESRGDRACIWAIRQMGCRPTIEAYAALYDRLKFDTLVLVDGGTDSLMRGDEEGIGTPQEDAASLVAAHALKGPRKFHVCAALGVDYFHGVGNGHSLEAIAELTRAGAFCGAFSLPPQTPEVQFFKNALSYVHSNMRGHESIVNSSLLSAMEGQFGDHHAIKRTEGSELAISPIMAIYWTFLLDPVAERLLYRKMIADTQSYSELTTKIEAFRDGLPMLRNHVRAMK
jgi:hypothetical protein